MGYVEEAVTSSTRAVEFDRAGQLEVASYYYREAARLLELAYKHGPENEEKPNWWRKAQEYKDRAEVLNKQRLESQEQQVQSAEQLKLQRCRFLLSHALDADESGDKEAAVQLYTQAVEHSLAARSETSDTEIHQKLTALARQALERAEDLKGIRQTQKLSSVEEGDSATTPPSSPAADPVKPRPTNTIVRNSVNNARPPPLHRGSSAHLKVSGKDTYSDEEKRVLLATSRINQIDYVPFMSVDLSER
ncbi:calpain-7-like [Homalodisca vitripennis]|uniref:calpain-7-like n=1 Tax=Homalodisca vitripennis TaxID=197043 RepID=UPI001EEB425E|nr:calpain-7-like [Homalodisca vitripennis]XP_046678915.1 calpain-7-like [Homalodisca vitripennis]